MVTRRLAGRFGSRISRGSTFCYATRRTGGLADRRARDHFRQGLTESCRAGSPHANRSRAEANHKVGRLMVSADAFNTDRIGRRCPDRTAVIALVAPHGRPRPRGEPQPRSCRHVQNKARQPLATSPVHPYASRLRRHRFVTLSPAGTRMSTIDIRLPPIRLMFTLRQIADRRAEFGKRRRCVPVGLRCSGSPRLASWPSNVRVLRHQIGVPRRSCRHRRRRVCPPAPNTGTGYRTGRNSADAYVAREGERRRRKRYRTVCCVW